MNNKVEEIRQLIDKLNKLNKSYYIDNVSLVSDYDFDMNMKQLQELEKETGIIFKDSPTQYVGSDLDKSGFANFNHKIPMGSVENCYDYESITAYFKKLWDIYCSDPEHSENVKFYNKVPYFLCVEPKFDGLSCSLHYQCGHLVKAATRGNGTVGADITENAKVINGIPTYIEKIAHVSEFEVRGEVLMPKSVFNQLNEERSREGLKLFANERNAASGSLKQLDPEVTRSRQLVFMPYNVFAKGDINISPFSSGYRYMQSECVDSYLPKLGFNKIPFMYCSVEQLEGVLELMKMTLAKEDFCVDGCVVKLNDKSLQDEYGYDKKCPDWCRAMKWKAETTKVRTKLLDVEWAVGKTGKITPTAILETCNITGTEVSRATLNNPDYIKDLDLRIGDYVTVERGGEVIPAIVEGYEGGTEERGENEVEIPKVCPICGGHLIYKVNINGEDSANLYCNNPDCNGILVEKLKYYCSKGCMDIDTLGDKTIEHLFHRTLLKTWKDIYYLNVMDLVVVGGFTEYSANKMVNAIKDAVKKANPSKLLYSIGIDGIARKTMDKILEVFDNDLEKLYNETNVYSKVSTVVGPVASSTFNEWMLSEGKSAIEFYMNKDDIVNQINGALTFNIKEEKETYSGNLNGKTFLATGTFGGYSRDEIKETVEKNGGKWMSGVSKNLDYLIVGEKAGSKLEKAQKLGIAILSEEDFNNMI